MSYRQFTVLLILPCFCLMSAGIQPSRLMANLSVANFMLEEEQEENHDTTEDESIYQILGLAEVQEDLKLTINKKKYSNYFKNIIGIFYLPNAFSPPESN